MPRKSYKPEEIVAKLRQVDVLTSRGQSVAEAIRSIGVSEVTYYRWRQEFGGLVQRAVHRQSRRRGRLLGTRQAQVLRCTRRQRVADRQGGARTQEDIRGFEPDHRRRERYRRSKPIAAALAAWADETRLKLSRKSELRRRLPLHAGALARSRCFDDERLALDNNPAERALRGVAIGLKNYLLPAPTLVAAAPRRCTR